MPAIQPQDLIDYALSFDSVPWAWGGSTIEGVDSSGLIYAVAQHFGIPMPRSSLDQMKLGSQVASISDAQAGDLVSFDSPSNGTSENIGIYLGNGQVIAADGPSTGVQVTSLSSGERVTGIARLPGVVNLNGQPPSGANSLNSLNALVSPMGTNSISAIPAARPTFDWWAGLGIKSPGLAGSDETYGLIDSFIGSDPELANLYSEAVAANWSQDAFVAALQETDWWKNNSDTARQALAQKTTDPATFNQSVSNKQVEIQNLAVQLGVNISANGLQNMASTAIILNQTDEQIKQQLSNYLTMSQQGWYGGYAGQVELGLKAYAQDQGVALDNAYIQRAVTGIVAGTDSLQARRALIQTQAASAFPAYANLINQGTTVGQIAAPYLSTMSKLWEVDPNSVDLFNPTLRAALQYQNKDGSPAVKQVYDFETQLRQDPRWLKTNNAREGLMGASRQVLGDMGLLSTDLGSGPQTSPTQLQYISPNTVNTGLSGQTQFPTLQNQQALANQAPPTLGSATDLAPNNSGVPTGSI